MNCDIRIVKDVHNRSNAASCAATIGTSEVSIDLQMQTLVTVYTNSKWRTAQVEREWKP
jgi:hypothetical protein